MTPAQYGVLTSSVLGALGTALLFFGSFAFEPHAGSYYGGPEMQKINAAIAARNKIRKSTQKLGLILLGASFAVQAATVFLP